MAEGEGIDVTDDETDADNETASVCCDSYMHNESPLIDLCLSFTSSMVTKNC